MGPLTMRRPPTGTAHSPYVKYAKVPYAYSATYWSWKKARMAGRDREAAKFAAEHATQQGYRLPSPSDRPRHLFIEPPTGAS